MHAVCPTQSKPPLAHALSATPGHSCTCLGQFLPRWPREIQESRFSSSSTQMNSSQISASLSRPWILQSCVLSLNVPYIQSYGFSNRCENWTIRKAKHQRTDAFELWCWRRLLRVSWTTKRSNQSILNEINPEYLLEGLMLKLKLQYFGALMRRVT